MANDTATVTQTVNSVTVEQPPQSSITVTETSGGSLTLSETTGTLTAVNVAPLASTLTIESEFAALNSPNFTGTPTAPTASPGTNTTQIATTAFVNSAVSLENSLSEMEDVNFASLGDNELLQYDSSSSKWKNQTIAEIGLATTSSLSAHTSATNNPHGVTATQVNLGNVTNESKTTMFSSPTFTGTPLAPTASAATNNTQLATTQYVTTAINNLIDSSPDTLNTLNELAAALNDDANFAGTITTSIATKLPLAGGTLTGVLTIPDGAANAPSLRFASHNSGLFATSGKLRFSVDGASRGYIGSAGIFSGGNVYTADTSEFRNYGGTWKATTGTTGNGFQFINSVDGTAMTLSSAGVLNVTGNITLGGTVDGRDVAADGAKLDGIETGATADQTASEIRTLVGSASDSNVFTDADHTKLDGIETGATADQTAAEILTAIKTVDGTGSGLDADTLDGSHASTFAAASDLSTHIGATNPHNITASTVGLGNVTNESKATMFTSAALTGTPTAPTASAGTNTTQIATTAFVNSAVALENSLAEMDDVMLSSVGDGELIVYNSGAWHNKTLTEAGILPLAGGTMTGNLTLQAAGPLLTANSTNNASGFRINVTGLDGDGDDLLRIQDAGTNRVHIKRDGYTTFADDVKASNLFVSNNAALKADGTGYLELGNTNSGVIQVGGDSGNSTIAPRFNNLKIQTSRDADDIIFLAGASTTELLRIDASASSIRIPDTVYLQVGSSSDLGIAFDGTNSIISNVTNDLNIQNYSSTGDINIQATNGSGGVVTYFTLDGSQQQMKANKNLVFFDNKRLRLGTSADADLYSTNANIFYDHNNYDALFRHLTADKDFVFSTTPSGGSLTELLRLDGSASSVNIPDSVTLKFGGGADLQIKHDGSGSYINQTGTGDLHIRQTIADKSIFLSADNGSGNATTYIQLNGGTGETIFYKPLRFLDDIKLSFGDNNKYRIDYDSSGYAYHQNLTGSTFFVNSEDDKDFIFQTHSGGNQRTILRLDASVPEASIAGNITLKDGTTATKIEVYETFTDTSNYERSFFKHASSFLEIGTEALGTGTASGLKLKTAGADRVTVLADGKVGIGTTDPDYILDIHTATNDQGIRVYTTPNTRPAFSLLVDSATNGNADWKLYHGTVVNTRITSNAGNATYFNAGKVGIGTSSPARKLEVSEGSSSIVAQFKSTSGTSAFITLANTTATADQIRVGSLGNDLVLSTNYVERLRILSGGNVGIGTTSPSYALSVKSDGADIELRDTATTGNARLFIRAGGTNGNSQIFFGDDDANDAGKIRYRHGGNSMSFDTNGAERMRIVSGGNVGIGTVSPNALLHVKSTGNGEVEIERDSGALINLQAQSARGVIGTDSNHELQLKTNAGTRMTLSTGGNVGIATTSPAYPLDVKKPTNNNDDTIVNLRANWANTTADKKIGSLQFIAYDEDVNSGADYIAAKIGARSTNVWTAASDVNSDIVFETVNAGNLGAKMRIKHDGKVGIGTSSPSHKLHVSGDARIEGDLTVNGDFTIVDTDVTTTEQLSITNDGTGPALIVNQTGSQPVIDFQDDGTSAFYIADGGSVGIGTTSPSAKLDIGSVFKFNTSTDLLTITNDQNTGGINLSGGNSRIYFGGYRAIEGDQSGGTLYLGEGYGTISLMDDTIVTGNVGIGTTSPSQKLSVVGGHIELDDNRHIQWGGSNNRITGNDASDYIRVFTAGNEVARFNASGKLGIGTASPARHLHINGGGINVLASFESTDAGAYLSFSDDSTTNDTSVRLGAIGNDLQIFSNGNERIRLNSSGSVGIGTTNPVAKLEVNGSIRTSTGAGATLTVFDDTVGRNNRIVAGADADGAYINSTYSSGGTGRIRFQTVQNERMRIEQNGNVGIGTTTVPHTLSVKGTISRLNSSGIQIINLGSSSDHGQLTINNSGGVTRVLLNSNGDDSYINAGNFGIGTTGPQSKFHVSGGDIRIDNNQQYLAETAGGGVIGVAKMDGSDNLLIGDGNLKIDVTGTTARLTIDSSGNTTVAGTLTVQGATVNIGNTLFLDNNEIWAKNSNNLNVKADGVIRIQPQSYGTAATFDSSGNVGIGTTSPQRKLHVDGGIRTNNDGIQFTDSNAFINRGGSYMQLRTYAGNDIILMAGGDVGIGTTTPAHKLDVSGSARLLATAPTLTLQDSDESNVFGQIIQSSGAFTIRSRDGSNHGDIRFERGNGSTIVESARFDSSGRLGIGTTSPSAKLTVRVDGNADTDQLRVENSSGRLFSVDNEGDVKVHGNLAMQDNAKVISARKISARDANGLLLTEDGGTTGISISDGGNTSIQGALTVVNNSSFTANLTVPSESKLFKDATINSTNDATIVTASNDTVLFSNPVPRVHHDLLAFNSNITQESHDGTSWSSSNLFQSVFDNKEDNSVTVISSSQNGVRWTVTGFAYTGATHVQINTTYSSGTGGDFEVTIESSSDGTNWTQRCQKTISIAARCIFLRHPYVGGDSYGRITIYRSSGTRNINVSNVRWSTNRAGDQGQGREYEFPYEWNYDRDLRVYSNLHLGAAITTSMSSSNASRLIVGDGSGAEGLTIYSGNTNGGYLYFADGTSGDASYRGAIQYSHSTDGLSFHTAGTATRMFINSTGGVGLGTSSINSGIGLQVQNGALYVYNGSAKIHDIRADYFASGNSLKLVSGGSGNIIFKVGETNEVSRFDSSGRLGIGTASPVEKFHVSNGASGFSGSYNARTTAIIESDNSSGTALSIMGKNTGNSAIFFGDQDGETVGQVYYNHPSNYLAFGASGATLAVLNATGLGIGTTSPSQKLDIAAGWIELDTAYGIQWGGTANRIWGSGGNNYIKIETNGVERLRVDGQGDVGIGFTNPSKKLHINGDIKLKNSGKLFLWNDNDNNYLDYQNWIASTGNAQLIRNTGAGGIKLKSTSLEVVVTTGLGIGTTSPAEKLHVSGNARIGSSATNGHLIGRKDYSVTQTFSTGLTVELGDHKACHVKVFISGDWSNHSSFAYVGEFFIQNTGNVGTYNEPGIILTEHDNLPTDGILSKIVDGTSDSFEIQFRANTSSATSVSGRLCYHVMGDATSVS